MYKHHRNYQHHYTSNHLLASPRASRTLHYYWPWLYTHCRPAASAHVHFWPGVYNNNSMLLSVQI